MLFGEYGTKWYEPTGSAEYKSPFVIGKTAPNICDGTTKNIRNYDELGYEERWYPRTKRQAI